MSKLLNNVLDRVSENNNEYREELQALYKSIEEKTNSIMGDVVTLSNYTIDFSNVILSAKEELINPISRIVESYTIKDLRSVETVNEQFVDKINDKLDSANISTKEEKDKFIDSLNTLLNDKYLEIVRIKRVDFVAVDGTNAAVEDVVNAFINNLISKVNMDMSRLNDIFNKYKKDIYDLIDNALNKISNIYLSNFVNEVITSLNAIVDLSSNDDVYSTFNTPNVNIPNMDIAHNLEQFNASLNPVTNDIPSVPEVPEIPLVPNVPEVSLSQELSEMPQVPNVDFNYETTSSNESDTITNEFESESFNPININETATAPRISEPSFDTYKPMEQIPVVPVGFDEKVPSQEVKKYDVDEILKIAKSPIMNISNQENEKDNTYLSIKPIEHTKDSSERELEFNEKEIVEEMIRRLSSRLELINERQEKISEQEQKIEEDETFVNDLIESSNNKKIELDNLEKELDKKEKELDEKKRELDKKLNDVLPFANAIMKNEETN